MCVSKPLTTDGYFFSDQPFHESETIEATQLAIMLGCYGPDTTEIILEAHVAARDDTPFQLVLKGCPQIVDHHNQPIPLEQLRKLPVRELSTRRLGEKGWTLDRSPYFEWLKGQAPLNGSRSSTIASCSSDQLNTLRNLL